MDHCPYCDHPLAPDQTQCPQCLRFVPDKLIQCLYHSDPNVRQRAAHDFMFIAKDERLVQALANALEDPAESVRREAGVNLFIAGATVKCVIPKLIAALDHPDVFVRRTSAAALSMVGADARDALDKLEQLRDTADDTLGAWVAEAIARIQPERSG